MWGIIIIIIIKNTCKTIGLLLEALIILTVTIGLLRSLEALIITTVMIIVILMIMMIILIIII